jgi:hypothetical protein
MDLLAAFSAQRPIELPTPANGEACRCLPRWHCAGPPVSSATFRCRHRCWRTCSGQPAASTGRWVHSAPNRTDRCPGEQLAGNRGLRRDGAGRLFVRRARPAPSARNRTGSTRRAPLIAWRQRVDPLGEGAALTSRIRALEPLDLDLDQHCGVKAWSLRYTSDVAIMNAIAPALAETTVAQPASHPADGWPAQVGEKRRELKAVAAKKRLAHMRS